MIIDTGSMTMIITNYFSTRSLLSSKILDESKDRVLKSSIAS